MATISLRRGLDWVSTGLYDQTIFNPATDYVVKYTLVNVTGDPGIYKAIVYLVNGTQNQYCIQHPDGPTYVLDGYDPFDCVYYMHWFNNKSVYTSPDGFAARSMAIDRFMVMPKNFVTCPLAGGNDVYTRTDPLNTYQGPYPGTDTICSSLSTYFVDGNGNNQLFTQYYYDPVNGIPSQWTGIEYIPVKDHSGINSANSVQFESAAYHRLFFQDEPFTFLNVDPTTSGLESLVATGGLVKTLTSSVTTYPALGKNGQSLVNKNSVFGCTKSLNFLIPSASAPYLSDPLASIKANTIYDPTGPYANINQAFSIDPYYQYYTCYQADVMGCYTNAAGVRVNLIQAGYIPSTPLVESFNLMADGGQSQTVCTAYVSNRYYASQKPNSFNAGSTIGTLTPIPFPVIGLDDPAVSLRDLPAPSANSTGMKLYKGVDYVLTGIYSPSDFPANSIVVKCNFNGVYVKLAVSQALGTAFFVVQYNGAYYILDSFDPFEVYYTLVPQWGNTYNTWTMQSDKSNSRMMHTFDKYPHFPSRIQPTGYSTSGSYNVLNTPMQYFYTSTSGTKKQFSHFSFDNSGDMTIQHGGDLFLFDPSTIQIVNPVLGNTYTSFNPTTQTRSLQYHQLFFAGEKCKAYNCTPDNMGNVYTDGRPSVGSLTNFLYSRTKSTSYKMTYFAKTDVGAVKCNGYASEFLESSITLEASIPFNTSASYGFHAVNTFLYQSSNNNYFPEINYGTTYFIGKRVVVPSAAGLYFDNAGNRFDVVQLSHYGGFYTCVESLANRISSAAISQMANYSLRCILDNFPTVDLIADQRASLAAAQAQIATLQASITADTAQIASLQSQVSSLQAQGGGGNSAALTAAQAQIAQLQAQVASSTSQITTLQSQASASAAQITSLQAQVAASAGTAAALATAQAQIATLQANIASSTAQITSLQAQVASLQSQGGGGGGGNSAALTAAQAQIATLQAQVAADTAQIADLQAQLAASGNPVATDQGFAINLFGAKLSLNQSQAVGAALLAGAGAAMGAILYFAPMIFP